MTYAQFLLAFIVPPILALAYRQPRPLGGVGGWRGRFSLPLCMAIAFVYTTPWDNYLVYREVWSYPADRVLATIGYVPIEEYVFFLLQPVLTGLLLYRLLARSTPPPATASTRANIVGALIYLACAAWGVWLLLAGPERGLYMGLILAWACPVLAGLWAWGGAFFWTWRKPLFTAAAVGTVYLWIADRIAIGLDIWYIADATRFGFDPLGLPIEEATFFLVTNLLVVQGTTLFLYGHRIAPPWRRRVASLS